MKSYKEVLGVIQSLNLKDYPHKTLKNHLRELGAFGVILTTLHKGKKIIRARINNNGESYDNVSKLSFKPPEFNNTYQRASTPNNTMFYGAVTPEYLQEGENELERITVFSELANSNKFLTDNSSRGELKITFARWDVIEDIHLVSLISHNDFQRGLHIFKQLQNDLSDALDGSKLKEQTLEISDFLAGEYAKADINGDYDYLISAIFSELAIEKYDGVYYPSVRMAGDGVNVAIKPDTVKSNLKFIGASECTIYKNEMNILIGNDKQSRTLENGNLEYMKLTNQPTPDYYRKKIGLE